MNKAKLRLFIIVVKRRMKEEGKSANEILNTYTALKIEEKNEILSALL